MRHIKSKLDGWVSRKNPRIYRMKMMESLSMVLVREASLLFESFLKTRAFREFKRKMRRVIGKGETLQYLMYNKAK